MPNLETKGPPAQSKPNQTNRPPSRSRRPPARTHHRVVAVRRDVSRGRDPHRAVESRGQTSQPLPNTCGLPHCIARDRAWSHVVRRQRQSNVTRIGHMRLGAVQSEIIECAAFCLMRSDMVGCNQSQSGAVRRGQTCLNAVRGSRKQALDHRCRFS